MLLNPTRDRHDAGSDPPGLVAKAGTIIESDESLADDLQQFADDTASGTATEDDVNLSIMLDLVRLGREGGAA